MLGMVSFIKFSLAALIIKQFDASLKKVVNTAKHLTPVNFSRTIFKFDVHYNPCLLGRRVCTNIYDQGSGLRIGHKTSVPAILDIHGGISWNYTTVKSARCIPLYHI